MIHRLGHISWLLSLFALLLAVPATGADHLRDLQTAAIQEKKADWGHWGPNPDKYSSWTTHSNRLIPLYSFGMDLSSCRGENSVYRDREKLEKLYGYLPEGTLNPKAEYFDQTDVYRLQKLAAENGKKCIVLFVFDGMDWQTTWAAAIAKAGKVGYREGRGTGLHFQDYREAPTDFGFYVTSPHDEGTTTDVNKQRVVTPGSLRGGYDPQSCGSTPWDAITDAEYPIGKGARFKHAYTDSASSATSLTCGIKTYNDSINVDPFGRQVEPISRKLQQAGYAVGVVTTVPISHATPACAYANNVHRDDYQDLTRDMIGLPSIAHPATPLPGLDVLIGAGWGESKDKDGPQGENFVSGNRYLTAKDLEAINAAGGGKYQIAQRTQGESGNQVLADTAKIAIQNHRRLFGYFGAKGGHLPFQTADGKFDPTISVGQTPAAEVYKPDDISENPRLAKMAVAALDVLSSRSDKIWLMVEAGDVDWANNANNLDNSIGATLSGDDAFQAVTQWIEKHVGWKDAALLLTSDHGHYLVLDKPEALVNKSAP
ncbi:MAG: alkaline phosphatase [Planctomycetales bacterium]|nr:alkaline phosphatase [Planctomycetales bacterium]